MTTSHTSWLRNGQSGGCWLQIALCTSVVQAGNDDNDDDHKICKVPKSFSRNTLKTGAVGSLTDQQCETKLKAETAQNYTSQN